MTEMATTRPAAFHYSAGTNEPVTRIVLHDEEYPVGIRSAENVAAYFSQASAGGSAHYCVDADSVAHPIAEKVIAWHAPPNQGSIGVEHDGYSRFTVADWQTPGSTATLDRSARLVAEICHRRGIPVRFLAAADLVRDPHAKGITTHAQVTAAFHQSDHTDPGVHFPINDYLAAVRSYVEHLTSKTPPAKPAVKPRRRWGWRW